MTFASVHRPLEAYAAALERAGLVIERIREPRTPLGASRTNRWWRVPLFLHLRARRPA